MPTRAKLEVERSLTCGDCGWSGRTFTFMGARPVWERVSSSCEGPWSAQWCSG